MKAFSTGLLGYGNMGKALVKGLLLDFPVTVYTRSADGKAHASGAGAAVAQSPEELAKKSLYIIVAVKPYQMAGVLEDLRAFLTPEHTVISVAAGPTIAGLQSALRGVCPVVRVMPNTFAAVGKGLFALCFDDPTLGEAARNDITAMFSSLGEVFTLPEAKMPAYGALAGCGPAYAFFFAEALIEAGVTLGFTRDEATRMGFSLLEGASKMAAATGQHPSILREQVTSPGGMTIAGTNHLDRTGLRGHIIDAVLAAWERGQEMENE